MNLLSVENLSKSFGELVLFSDISFGISTGQKIGLVARNGSGKTTLFRILEGKELPDSGQIAFRKGIRVGFLEQDPSFDPEISVYEALFTGDSPQMQAVRSYERALHRYELNPDEDSRGELERCMQGMEEARAWDMESRIKVVLDKLEIRNQEQKTGELSGGQIKRLALATLLIDEPDLLILDEPTNHLDIEMIEWLEAWIGRSQVSLLLVTHDRHFLDNLCEEILEMSQKTLFRHQGNYEYFLEKKAEREFNESRELEKDKNLFRRELEWVRRQPKARGTKSKSRLEAFEYLSEKVKKRQSEKDLEMGFKMTRLGNKILELRQVSKSYSGKPLIRQFTHVFRKGERLGIVGRNGSGKSTLLNLITSTLPPDSGEVITGETVKFGYYTQSGLKFNEGQRVIEVVREIGDALTMSDGSILNAAQLLKRFGFAPEMHFSPVSKLSGGERKRLYLLCILMGNPNFLILDEPTNDLDLDTLAVLENFLSEFPGCLVIVSHDRYFLDRICEHLFIFEGQGRILDFNGSYTEYRWLKNEQEKQAKESAVHALKEEATPVSVPEQSRKLSFKEKQELESLNLEIPELEKRKAELESRLSAANVDHETLVQISKEHQEVSELLDEKELRWLELSIFPSTTS